MSILILHGQTSALWREGDRSSASNGLLPIFILITACASQAASKI
ncbi:hypothetical protein [Coleofasciculus sp. FACHB-SPT9]|nr:hypothetical protein [Coleofasciculus sp. FACHB-SPT9]